MRVAVAMVIIFGVVVFAIVLIGLLWAIVLLVPFYAHVGIAVYLIWRSNRRKAELEALVVRDVERQRLFNEQEMRAWNSSLDDDRQEPPRPEEVSRYQPAPPWPRTSEDR